MTSQTDRAFNHLASNGMIADRDLLGLFDLDAFDRDPARFTREAMTAKPWAFGLADVGTINATKATAAERRDYMRRLDAHESRMADRTFVAAAQAHGDVRQMSADEYAKAKRSIGIR